MVLQVGVRRMEPEGSTAGPAGRLRRETPRASRLLVVIVLVATIGFSATAVIGQGRYGRFNPNCPCSMCSFIRQYGWDAWVAYVDGRWVPPEQRAAFERAEFEPTPDEAIKLAVGEFKRLGVGPRSVLYDLGAGDARVLIAARNELGCKGVGIELDPLVAAQARARVESSHTGGIRITEGDATEFELDGATHVYMYLFEDTMEELARKIPAWVPIVSYAHPIHGRPASQCRSVKGRGGIVLYVYEATVINLRPL